MAERGLDGFKLLHDFSCRRIKRRSMGKENGRAGPVFTFALMPCIFAMSCKCLRGVAAKFTLCTQDGMLIGSVGCG